MSTQPLLCFKDVKIDFCLQIYISMCINIIVWISLIKFTLFKMRNFVKGQLSKMNDFVKGLFLA